MLAPKWYAGLHWEDVMIGLLLNDYATFQPHGGEYSAKGREMQYPVVGCTQDAAVPSLCLVKQTAAQACSAELLQAATCSSITLVVCCVQALRQPGSLVSLTLSSATWMLRLCSSWQCYMRQTRLALGTTKPSAASRIPTAMQTMITGTGNAGGIRSKMCQQCSIQHMLLQYCGQQNACQASVKHGIEVSCGLSFTRIAVH